MRNNENDITVTKENDSVLKILVPSEISESDFNAMYYELNGDDYHNILFRLAVAVPGNRKYCEMTWVKKDGAKEADEE